MNISYNSFLLHTHVRCIGLLLYLITQNINTHAMGLPGIRDRPLEEASTSSKRKIHKKNLPCPHRDSNLQSQQASGHKNRGRWKCEFKIGNKCLSMCWNALSSE
jgi:hypothetical protein